MKPSAAKNRGPKLWKGPRPHGRKVTVPVVGFVEDDVVTLTPAGEAKLAELFHKAKAQNKPADRGRR